MFSPALAIFSSSFSASSASRGLGVLVLALTGCQPGPARTRPAVDPLAPAAGMESLGGLFGASLSSVEADLDATQAASEGVRAVLLELPPKERERLLTRWLPLSPGSGESGAPGSVELLTTVRGLFASQGSRDLALATFFVGPEPVARALQRLRLPVERVSLEKLAGRLPRRELRYAREARSWAGLYALTWPVERDWRLSSPFGPRLHPLDSTLREHRGVDISVPVGTAVRAPAAGVVVGVREGPANGRWVELLHEGGLRTIFCHLSEVSVKAGQKVASGERVALSGETGRVTGPHLHYQVQYAGAWMDPVGIRASAERVAQPLSWKTEPLASPTVHAAIRPDPG